MPSAASSHQRRAARSELAPNREALWSQVLASSLDAVLSAMRQRTEPVDSIGASELRAREATERVTNEVRRLALSSGVIKVAKQVFTVDDALGARQQTHTAPRGGELGHNPVFVRVAAAELNPQGTP